ncbi:glycosyltransferase [Paenibacillus sp. FSL L8-0435]|uniref:glycosyltransferase family 2 protein n=1 Tax=Paenibacillus sp. FSL L8-0435 TaxID=2954618 RepID=UPI0030D97870
MSGYEVKISVIIPTYERSSYLLRLLRRLCQSRYKHFDVIIIDQSEQPTNVDRFLDRLNMQYHHVSFRGAGLARNFGAKIATGAIIAFTDDDCIPSKNWLSKASELFLEKDIIGIEGRIYAPKYKTNPKKYRVVSNRGLENFGFMTANLFLKREYFHRVGGFDERFNNPHFREDTDFGWRLQRYGEILFSEDVKVLHPSERYREETNRNHFFVHDALLFHKHPEKYLELFIKEKHYITNSKFWENFLSGFERHHVNKELLHKLLQHNSIDLGYVPLFRIFPFIKNSVI